MAIDPITLSIISSLGGGVINKLFGSKDKFQMSPQSQQLFDQITKQLGQFQGFSPQERSQTLGKIKTGLQDESAIGAKRSQASQVRRGVFDPGSFTATQAGVRGEFGKAFGDATTDIDLASFARDRGVKDSLRQNQLSLLGGERFTQGQGVAGIGDLSELISFYLNKGKGNQQNKPTLMDIFANAN